MTQRGRETDRDAYATFMSAKTAQPDHLYLVRKQVGLYGDLRQMDGDLPVPLYDIRTDEFVTYQRIHNDGGESLASPAEGRCMAFTIAKDIKEGPVILCGETASALTIYEALSYTTVCSVVPKDPVQIADKLREKYRGREIYLTVDDKASTELEMTRRPLSLRFNGILRPPFFAEDPNTASTWNDYAILHGSDATERALRKQIDDARATPDKKRRRESIEKIKQRTRLINAADLMKRELPEIKWAIDGILPAGLGVLIGLVFYGLSTCKCAALYCVTTE